MCSYARYFLSALVVLAFAHPASSQQKITVKPGAKFDMRLLTPIDAGKMKVGEIVTLETVRPLSVGSYDLPAKTMAYGRVVNVSLPSNKNGEAQLTLVVEKIAAKDFEIILHGYPTHLVHGIARSEKVGRQSSRPQLEGAVVSPGGPPPVSGVKEQPARPRQPVSIVPSEPPVVEVQAAVQLLEPMPTVKRTKQPPSTILKDRGNVRVSTGTIILVEEFRHDN